MRLELFLTCFCFLVLMTSGEDFAFEELDDPSAPLFTKKELEAVMKCLVENNIPAPKFGTITEERWKEWSLEDRAKIISCYGKVRTKQKEDL